MVQPRPLSGSRRDLDRPSPIQQPRLLSRPSLDPDRTSPS